MEESMLAGSAGCRIGLQLNRRPFEVQVDSNLHGEVELLIFTQNAVPERFEGLSGCLVSVDR